MAKRGVPKLGASSARGDHLVHVKVGGLLWVPRGLHVGEGVQQGRAAGLAVAGAWRSTGPQARPLLGPQVRIPKTLGSEEKQLVEKLRELQSGAAAGAGAKRGWF